MIFDQKMTFVSERAPQGEQNSANFSFVAPSSFAQRISFIALTVTDSSSIKLGLIPEPAVTRR